MPYNGGDSAHEKRKEATKAKKAAKHRRQLDAEVANKSYALPAWQYAKAKRFLKRHPETA